MTVKRFFPVSIVDEMAYLFEMSTPYSLTFGFVMTLEGEVDTEVVFQLAIFFLFDECGSGFQRTLVPALVKILVGDADDFRHAVLDAVGQEFPDFGSDSGQILVPPLWSVLPED